MKRLLLLCGAILCTSVLYAGEENLYERYKDYGEIKVFLKDVTNETGASEVNTDVFRKVFKDALEKRKEIKFASVNDEKSADVIISARIMQYGFIEKASPMFFSSAMLVADTLSPKSSGKVAADYEVRTPSDDKVILSYKSFTTEERRPRADMKGEMGFVYSIGRNIDRFIFRAFYEKK